MNRKQIWKKLLLVLGALLLAWLMVVLFFDPPPPDDSDLALPERKIDPAQNPFPEILRFSMPGEELETAFSAFLEREAFNRPQIQELLQSYQKDLDQFEYYSDLRDWDRGPAGDPVIEKQYAGASLGLAILTSCESAKIASVGDITTAIGKALSILNFGIGLGSAGAPLGPSYTSSEMIIQEGVFSLLELVEHSPLSDQQLLGMKDHLGNVYITKNNLATLLRSEYASFYRRGNRPILNPSYFRSYDRGGFKTPPWLPSRLAHKPNLTLALDAQFFRVAILASDKDFEHFCNSVDSAAWPGWRTRWVHRLLGNPRGLDEASKSADYAQVLDGSFVNRARLVLLRTRIAMELYRLAHGDWPRDLQALVPAFLSEIPIDPMDGAPLRYDLSRRLIYSIGTDLIDGGGVATGEPYPMGERREIVIELEPAVDSKARP